VRLVVCMETQRGVARDVDVFECDSIALALWRACVAGLHLRDARWVRLDSMESARRYVGGGLSV
jgi:hypothetical protein